MYPTLALGQRHLPADSSAYATAALASRAAATSLAESSAVDQVFASSHGDDSASLLT